MIDSLPPYTPARWLRSGHLQTVLPGLFRAVPDVRYRRERIDTPDADFLDLDWSPAPSLDGGPRRLVVLSHGLEGSANRPYVRGMARAFNAHGWDILAWNYRGCSGEPNRRFHTYHSGATEDLNLVIRHALDGYHYETIALVGFSLGGNITLKYLGERGADVDARIVGGAAFSVPCDLASSAAFMMRSEAYPYMRRFMNSLDAKVREKLTRYPGRLPEADITKMRSFREFDDYYTAPAHGFVDAEDYWRRASALGYLGGIRVPTLLVNAKDDPFLSAECFPYEAAEANPHLHLLAPDWGGHVGFMTTGIDGEYWSEQVATAFLERVLRGNTSARQAA